MFDKLIDIILRIIHWFQFWTVVEPWQRALVTRLGAVRRTLQPGFHLYFPFEIERIIHQDVLCHISTLDPQSVYTRDGKAVVLRATVIWRINDVEAFLTQIDDAEQSLSEAICPYIAAKIREVDFAGLTEAKLVADIKQYVANRVRKWGVGVVEFGFRDVTPARSFRIWNESNDTLSF